MRLRPFIAYNALLLVAVWICLDALDSRQPVVLGVLIAGVVVSLAWGCAGLAALADEITGRR